ncbi:MFS transporter, partial [Streptomyces sp. NPDC005180]
RHPSPGAPGALGRSASTADAPAAGPARLSGRTRRLVALFGVIALCTAYGEGALADWGALHLEQDLGAHAGVAAAGYSLFALAMTAGRLSGTTLLERLGQTRTLVAGGATAAVGMLLGALAPTVWLALLGFAVTGLGLANIFPVAVARAGALAGPSGVAAASTLGYGGMLLGPPAIGFLADWFSLPVALTTVAILAAAAALIGYAARKAPAGTGQEPIQHSQAGRDRSGHAPRREHAH